jgi:hypothetical protein
MTAQPMGLAFEQVEPPPRRASSIADLPRRRRQEIASS